MGVCWATFLLVIGFAIYWSIKGSNMNKQSREQADSLPNENKLLSMYDDNKPEKLQEMYSLGAKIIFLEPSFSLFDKTILTNNALCFKNSAHRFFVTPPSLYAEIKFDVETNTATYTTTKNKSTVGRAIVGGALAGGVGAVVGAASAMSGNGTKTVSRRYNTGTYRLKIKLSDISDIKPTILYVSNELIDNLGQLFPNGQQEEGSPYTKYNIGSIDMLQKNRIVEYVQKVINTR